MERKDEVPFEVHDTENYIELKEKPKWIDECRQKKKERCINFFRLLIHALFL